MELNFQLSGTVNGKQKAATDIRVTTIFNCCFSILIKRQMNREKRIDGRRRQVSFRNIFTDECTKRKPIRFLK